MRCGLLVLVEGQPPQVTLAGRGQRGLHLVGRQKAVQVRQPRSRAHCHVEIVRGKVPNAGQLAGGEPYTLACTCMYLHCRCTRGAAAVTGRQALLPRARRWRVRNRRAAQTLWQTGLLAIYRGGPGWASPCGSKTCFASDVAASSLPLYITRMNLRFSMPTPCSPVMLPSCSTHR